MRTLKAAVDAALISREYEDRDKVRAMVPAIVARPTWGKKQIVAATVAAMLGIRIDNVRVRVALDNIARATSWFAEHAEAKHERPLFDATRRV